MFKILIVILSLTFLLIGCGTPPANIEYSEPKSNKALNVYSLIQQTELEANALPSGEVNTNDEDVNLAIIQKSMSGINVDKLFEDALGSNLKVNINKVITVKTKKALDLETMKEETYILLKSNYKMDADYRTPIITTEVNLVSSNKGETDGLLYRNYFTYFGQTLPKASIVADEEDSKVLAKIDKVKTDFKALPTKSQKDPQIKAKYHKNLKDLGARENALNKGFDYLVFQRENHVFSKAWANAYKAQLEGFFLDGIPDLISIISKDIISEKSNIKPDNKAQLKGYPEFYNVTKVDDKNNRQVIRFTNGIKAGTICSMPQGYNEGKLVCL